MKRAVAKDSLNEPALRAGDKPSVPTNKRESDDSRTPQILHAINSCIEACVDGEKRCATAAADVRDPKLKALMHGYATQWARFVGELQRAIEGLGGVPENHGTAGGTLHRAFTGVRMALEGRADTLILDECEQGDERALVVYEAAFAGMPLDAASAWLGELLLDHRNAIKHGLTQLMNEDLVRRSAATH